MAIYYVDLENGNDTNDGLSWLTPWKTLYSGATKSRVHSGDEVRIAKSPDPVLLGEAIWYNKSRFIELTTFPTKTIEWQDAANPWVTESANVTLIGSSQSSAKVHLDTTQITEYTTSFRTLAGFTTGKIAHKIILPDHETDSPLGYLSAPFDYSGFQKISFWIAPMTVIPANRIKICLCSDLLGDVIVDEFVFPAITNTVTEIMTSVTDLSKWIPITINKGSALGSSIQSIALYAIQDPGIIYFYLDGIILCNDFSLNSLISKNPYITGGEEGWYPINGVKGQRTGPDYGKYFGITEKVKTYYRNPILMTDPDALMIYQIGTYPDYVTFKGGYDPETDIQDGETFCSFRTGVGTGLWIRECECVKVERINVVRATNGLYIWDSMLCEVSAQTMAANSQYGCRCELSYYQDNTVQESIQDTSTIKWYDIKIKNVNNNVVEGVHLYHVVGNFEFINVNGNGDPNFGVASIFNSRVKANNCLVLTDYSVSIVTAINTLFEFLNTNSYFALGNSYTGESGGCDGNIFLNCIFEILMVGSGESYSYRNSLGFNTFKNPIFDETYVPDVLIKSINILYPHKVIFENINGTGMNRIYHGNGYTGTQIDVRHTKLGVAWVFDLTGNNRITFLRYQLNEIPLSLARIAVNANVQVTVSLWFLKKHEYVNGMLFIQGQQVSGIDSDLVSKMTVGVNTWEQLTLQFIPTESGIVEIQAKGYFLFGAFEYYATNTSNFLVYVDDLSYSQG